MLFDAKNFNGEVFDTLVRTTPNLRLNELLKSGAVIEKNEYAAMLKDQQGGHFITTIIKARIGGKTVNYDGKTKITATSRGNYTMGRIVIGRAQAWTEKDFSADITGDDYEAAAGEVAEFWDDVDQDTLIATLNGVFSMVSSEGKKFVELHTYDVSDRPEGNMFDVTTLNTGMQRALGDKKAKFSLAVMHSAVSTNLENLNLVGYMKYTDENGIQKDLKLYTLNGRLVLVDDTMPVVEVDPSYALTADTTPDSSKDYYTRVGSGTKSSPYVYTLVEVPDASAMAGYYEMKAEGYKKYVTYVLGDGSIEYTDCGTKTPSELARDAFTNGGETSLVTRQRKVFAPYGISWVDNTVISPTNEQLEDGNNWDIASNNAEGSGKKEYYPIKAIPIARIITRG